MELKIKKKTSVSIHDQLVTQLSMQIASGVIKPGSRLPSLRALANRLDIHYNTCLAVYQQLQEVGLITIKKGSGARVIDEKSQLENLSKPDFNLTDMCRFFIRQTAEKNYDWDEVLKELNRLHTEHSDVEQAVVFVDLHTDILPVFQVELETYLNRSVLPAPLETLNVKRYKNAHYIVNRYHYQGLRQKLEEAGLYNEKDITVIEVGSAQKELELIKKLPEGALVSVISESATILQQAEAVITALRGHELLLNTVLSTAARQRDIQDALRRADMLFVDSYCYTTLQNATKKQMIRIEVIPESELEKLSPFKHS